MHVVVVGNTQAIANATKPIVSTFHKTCSIDQNRCTKSCFEQF